MSLSLSLSRFLSLCIYTCIYIYIYIFLKQAPSSRTRVVVSGFVGHGIRSAPALAIISQATPDGGEMVLQRGLPAQKKAGFSVLSVSDGHRATGFARRRSCQFRTPRVQVLYLLNIIAIHNLEALYTVVLWTPGGSSLICGKRMKKLRSPNPPACVIGSYPKVEPLRGAPQENTTPSLYMAPYPLKGLLNSAPPGDPKPRGTTPRVRPESFGLLDLQAAAASFQVCEDLLGCLPVGYLDSDFLVVSIWSC